jgi:hypothetical protein
MPNNPSIVASLVPLRNPSASEEKCRFAGIGDGGNEECLWNAVMNPHTSSSTTITVVTCITLSALSVDSSIPLVFCHQ